MADVVEATLVVALFSMRAPGDHQGRPTAMRVFPSCPLVPWSASDERNCACATPTRTLISRPGNSMQRNQKRNKPLWRGLVGCVIAYALIINALLSGVLGAEWVARAAAGLVGEHCLTDARAAT